MPFFKFTIEYTVITRKRKEKLSGLAKNLNLDKHAGISENIRERAGSSVDFQIVRNNRIKADVTMTDLTKIMPVLPHAE